MTLVTSSRQNGNQKNDTWYTTVWFIAVIAVLLILAVFAVVALCLRRTTDDRKVFIRDRDPLPVRPKSRSTVESDGSTYTLSEARFNLGMVSFGMHCEEGK